MIFNPLRLIWSLCVCIYILLIFELKWVGFFWLHVFECEKEDGRLIVMMHNDPLSAIISLNFSCVK